MQAFSVIARFSLGASDIILCSVLPTQRKFYVSCDSATLIANCCAALTTWFDCIARTVQSMCYSSRRFCTWSLMSTMRGVVMAIS